MAVVRWEPEFPHFGRWPRWMRLFEEEWPELSEAEGLNIYETDNDVVVEAAIPGVPSDKVEVTVEGNVLKIFGGHEEKEEEKKKKKVVYRSACKRSFSYATSLPRAVQGNKAEAEVEDGIVRVTIPKAETERPKKIMVKKGKK